MKKYIQRNEKDKPGSVWHTDPRCITIRYDNKVIIAPDSMLKAYDITEQCGICRLRDERNEKFDKEDDLREVHEILVLGASIIEKEVSRDFLREELLKREIKFNLRESKNVLARKLCRCWLRDKDYIVLKELTEEAITHWNTRIDIGDRHRPEYYRSMLQRSERLINLIYNLH